MSWFEYFNPAAPPHAGGSTFQYSTPLGAYPVFGRTGALLPLHVSTPLGLVPQGDESWASALTLLLHAPVAGSTIRPCVVPEFGEPSGVEVTCSYEQNGSDGMNSLRCAMTPYDRDVIILIRGVPSCPSTIVSASYGSSQVLLKKMPSPLVRHAASFAPLAISWDAAGPAPIYPLHGLQDRLSAAATPISRSWSYSAAAIEADSRVTVDELAIRLGSIKDGATVEVANLGCAVQNV